MPFSPGDLYSTEAGWWMDASDLSTLWQDSAGTTPVALDGDPVGKWDDKSGNGNHATQTINAQRMLWESATTSIKNNGTSDGFLDLPSHTWTGVFTFAGVWVPSSTTILSGRLGTATTYFGHITSRPRLTVNGQSSFSDVVVGFARNFQIGWRDASNDVRATWMGIDTRGTGNSAAAAVWDSIGRISTGTYMAGAARLCEVVAIERLLTDTEKNNLRDYFNTKWDIGLVNPPVSGGGTLFNIIGAA